MLFEYPAVLRTVLPVNRSELVPPFITKSKPLLNVLRNVLLVIRSVFVAGGLVDIRKPCWPSWIGPATMLSEKFEPVTFSVIVVLLFSTKNWRARLLWKFEF